MLVVKQADAHFTMENDEPVWEWKTLEVTGNLDSSAGKGRIGWRSVFELESALFQVGRCLWKWHAEAQARIAAVLHVLFCNPSEQLIRLMIVVIYAA